MSRRDVVAELAPGMGRGRRPHPIRAAIDGLDAASKTTLADALIRAVERGGRSVIRASIDGFQHLAAVRCRQGGRQITALFVLCALPLSGAMLPESRSQASSWVQFRAGTDAERHEDDFWDDAHSPRLKPGETSIEGLHKDYGSSLAPHAYDDFIRRWTCDSDDVVVGTPTTTKSILTTHESNIFTDYRVNVDQWLRGGSDRSKSVVIPTTFVVSLEGGRITTGEGVLQVEDDPPLQLFAPFILFLKTIPTTSSYRLAGPALTAARTTVVLKGNYFVPPELLNGNKVTSEALSDIRSAAGKCGGR